MPEEATLLKEKIGRVGLIRMNRAKGNALDSALLTALMDALAEFDQDSAVGAMVITGNERLFSVGADIKQMTGTSAVDMLVQDYISIFDRIRSVKKPIIAAVSGWCLGGGNELALSCDLIVASESAKFGQPEVNLGVIPGAGGTQRLARAIGKYLTMEMVLNNRTLTADEALRLGLVNRVVPVESYLQEALSLAAEIAEKAPLALRMAKEAVDHAFESFLSEGIADERRAFYFLFATQDQKEGMQAFTEKRQPEWKGV